MLQRRAFFTESAQAEIEAMIGLLRRARPRAWLADSPGITDLHELLVLADVQKSTLIWQDEHGSMQAFAFVDPYNNLLFECADAGQFSALFYEAVEKGMDFLRKTQGHVTPRPTLDASCRSDDRQRLTCLTNEGFAAETYQSVMLRRGLDEPIPAPHLPHGFSIRPLAGKSELEEYVALHQVVFGTEQMTMEIRQAIMDSPEYDGSLDLVAISPQGKLAALCVCQIFKEENEITGEKVGWTDPVGVQPDFQGKGLGQALMLRGLQLLKDRGMQQAALGTRSDNLGMLALARKCGFQITHSRLWFSKPIS